MDKKLNFNFKLPLRYHIIFWLGYFIFNVIRFGSLNDDYWYSVKSNLLVEFPLNIIITYFTIYYLIPKYILKKKYIQFFFYFTSSLTLFYFLKTGLTYFLVTKNIWPEEEGIRKAFTFNHIVEVTIGYIYVVTFVSAIKLTYDWINEKRRNEELKKIQLQTELNFLKNQIQPHFFFNTLNNLYALVIAKSDTAPDVVLKLSEIMQYVLYEAKEAKVNMLKSLNYTMNYLDLEKIRYGDKVKSSIDIKGNIDNIDVPPLLFLPFIENCFKHGTQNNDDIIVEIYFEIIGNFLYFTVENTFDNQNITPTNHGIGIQNVKRRLQLLYPGNFMLKNEIKENKYIVNLKIPVE